MRTLKDCLTLLLFLFIFTFFTKQANHQLKKAEINELGSQLNSVSSP